MKHFIALVKMGGKYTGRIGQHSTQQPCESDAITWANNRFNRKAVIVDMAKHDNANSLPNEVAEKLYNEAP